MDIYWIMQPDSGMGDMVLYDCNNKVAVDDYSKRQKLLDQRVFITRGHARETRKDGFRYWQGRNSCRNMSYVEFPSVSKDDAGRIRLVGMLFVNSRENNVSREEFESKIIAVAKSIGIELANNDDLKHTFDLNQQHKLPIGGYCGIIAGSLLFIILVASIHLL